MAFGNVCFLVRIFIHNFVSFFIIDSVSVSIFFRIRFKQRVAWWINHPLISEYYYLLILTSKVDMFLIKMLLLIPGSYSLDLKVWIWKIYYFRITVIKKRCFGVLFLVVKILELAHDVVIHVIIIAFLFIEEDSGELAKPKINFPETAEEELGKY